MQENKWKVVFAGDIVIKENYQKIMSDNLKKYIKSSDIAICNFEAPVKLSDSKPISKAGPHLFQNEKSIDLIKDAGFNVINLANNHIYDYGDSGLRETLNNFSDLTTIGAGMTFEEAYRPKELIIGSVKIGIISLCEAEFGVLIEKNSTRGGYAWINHSSVNTIISEMKKKYDIVLVQAHAGIENIDQPIPEWRTRYKEIIDMGADAVIGSHPHIIQGWEMYKEKPIFYSIGNFYFDNKKTKKDTAWNTGLLLSFEYNGTNLEKITPQLIRVTDGVVDFLYDNSYEQKLKKINDLLENESDYINYINQKALDLWEDVYKKYYIIALDSINTNKKILENIKTFIKFFLKKTKINNDLLLHNIRIESHRHMITRALSIHNEKINKNI